MSFLRLVYKNIFKEIFFRFDPEGVHDRVTTLGEFLAQFSLVRKIFRFIFSYQNPVLNQNLWNVKFKNPVGLAAGFDKDGRLYPIMESIGFGFVEIGTVTFKSYDGNQKPRLYRLPKSKGLIVNYGLKNIGAPAIVSYLRNREKNIPQVISIGHTNSAEAAPFEKSIEDYGNCLKFFIEAKVGDIYEINISCPNMFGGESFAEPEKLKTLLQRLDILKSEKPVFLKMPINLCWEEFKKIVDVALDFKIKALVIGNLNKNRADEKIKDAIPEDIKGNISGKPTEDLSNFLIAETYKYCGDKIKIIGVGGIFSAEDAYEKIKRGASLIELITGIIYEGPQLIGEINKGLAELLIKDGHKNISQAVGAYFKRAKEKAA